MKSLLWINQFALLPSEGGGTRHFELGRELTAKDWQVTIFSSDFHLHSRQYMRRDSEVDRETKQLTLEGVEMRWLYAAQYLKNDWRRALNWYSFSRSIGREAKELTKQPDVVIGSSPQLFAAVSGRKLAREMGVPFVFEVRDLWPESLLAAGGRRGPAYRILDRVADSLYRDADRIIVLAKGSADYLVKKGIPAQKIAYIPNGVDVTAIGPKESYQKTGKDPLTLIYAGAHGPANGLDRVLDAAEILGTSAGVRFLFVGDGPVKSHLIEDARRRHLSQVEFRDPVSKPDLAKMLNTADAGLMVLRDSHLFSFGVSPNKMFDYLAAGLPVVCNVPGEVAGMLDAARAGVQATDASGLALAEAIKKFKSKSEEELEKMGRNGRAWVSESHSRSVLGEQLNDLLCELVSG